MSKTTIQFYFNNLVDEISFLYPKQEAISIAFVVVEHVLNYSKFEYAKHRQDDFPLSLKKQWGEITKELSTGKPVQYIIGFAPFYGLNFKVNSFVLIPRPETEELVDMVLKENVCDKLHLIDIGTGSGCISISIKVHRKKWDIYATDISKDAIMVAKENAKQKNAEIHFFEDDIFNSSVVKKDVKFDILVSNPPYIPVSEKIKMHKNVIEFEPYLALFANEDDVVKYYKAIALFAKENLHSAGKVYVEIHENFSKEVCEIFNENGFENTCMVNDINGKPRIVKAIL